MTPDELAKHGLRVKPLGWDDMGGDFARAAAPLFGNIRVEKYSDNFTVAWSVPGFTDTLTDGEWATFADAKAAAQADYTARICAALEPITPPDVAQAARVLLADDAALTELAIGIMRKNKADAKGNRPGYQPALIAALRSLLPEGGDA